MKNIIEKIARDYGVTPVEVERDIREAIELARHNPQAKEFWSEFQGGSEPEIDAVIKKIISLCTH